MKKYQQCVGSGKKNLGNTNSIKTISEVKFHSAAKRDKGLNKYKLKTYGNQKLCQK